MLSNTLFSPQSFSERGSQDGTVIFTVCSVNYLIKAIALGLSVLDHHDDVDFTILVADGKRPIELEDPRIHLLWAEDLGFPTYLHCAFKYNIIEFNTALKPYVTLHLLGKYQRVIYLDPDVCVYSPLISVLEGLSDYTAVFTPHALSPYEGLGRPSDRDLLRFGSNNLGFFAIRRCDEARKMLYWWHNRCLAECFYEPQLGLGVDQKWIDLTFGFFDGIGLLKDPGLNVAFWNLHERKVSCTADGWRINGHYKLGFVHFSSFVEQDTLAVADKQSRYASGTRPDFTQVAEVYRDYLTRAKPLVRVSDFRYSYSHFDNGDTISPTLRRFYAISVRPDIHAAANPFAAGGTVHQFAKNNGLISRHGVSTAHKTFKEKAEFSREQRIIAVFFRLTLRFLGPDRYFNLMRYIAHYSSLLNQTDLFRK